MKISELIKKLVVIQEWANYSSGYPYWVFHFNSGDNE